MKQLFLILAAILTSLNVHAGCIEGDCVNGKGKYTWPDGNVYEGDWRDDKRTGKGKYTWPNGNVYEGDWRDDKRTGKGKKTWAGGNVYEGDWRDDKMTGKGKGTWASGNVYEGDFIDGNRTGKGKKTYADGSVEDGYWRDNEFVETIAEREKRLAKEKQEKFDKVYNACLLDKSSNVDMQVSSIEVAVKSSCKSIAEKPSWLESWKYE